MKTLQAPRLAVVRFRGGDVIATSAGAKYVSVSGYGNTVQGDGTLTFGSSVFNASNMSTNNERKVLKHDLSVYFGVENAVYLFRGNGGTTYDGGALFNNDAAGTPILEDGSYVDSGEASGNTRYLIRQAQ